MPARYNEGLTRTVATGLGRGGALRSSWPNCSSGALALLFAHLRDVPDRVRCRHAVGFRRGDDLAPQDVAVVTMAVLRDSAATVGTHSVASFRMGCVSVALASQGGAPPEPGRRPIVPRASPPNER